MRRLNRALDKAHLQYTLIMTSKYSGSNVLTNGRFTRFYAVNAENALLYENLFNQLRNMLRQQDLTNGNNYVPKTA